MEGVGGHLQHPVQLQATAQLLTRVVHEPQLQHLAPKTVGPHLQVAGHSVEGLGQDAELVSPLGLKPRAEVPDCQPLERLNHRLDGAGDPVGEEIPGPH